MKVMTSDCSAATDFDPTQSRLLMNLLDACDEEGGCPPPVPIDTKTLDRVSHWMNIPTEDPEEPWDTLMAMAHATDFLDMPELMDRTCRRMANELKGRPPAEIRQMMGRAKDE